MKLEIITNTFKHKIFKSIILLSCSSIFAFLIFYPDFYQYNLNLDQLTYFSFHESDFFSNSDETIVGPSIREVYDFFRTGDLNLKNPTSLINNSSYNIQFIPYIFAGILSYILGSVENFFFLKNFIFPFIIFIISFYFLFSIFKNFYFSLLCSVFLTTKKFALVNIFNYYLFDKSAFIDFVGISPVVNKFPSHQFTFIFFFLGLLSLYKILEGKKFKNLLIICGTVLAYSHIFTFISLSFSIFFIFLYATIVNAKFKNEVFISGLIIFVSAIPSLYIIYFQDYRIDHLISLGFTQSQNFNINPYAVKSFLYICACLFLVYQNKKKYINISLIIISQTLLLILFYYSSYFFFILPEPQHFILNYYLSKILIILLVFNFFMNLNFNNKVKKLIYLFTSTIPIIFILNIAVQQVEIANRNLDIKPKEIKKLLNWIEINSEKNSHFLSIDPTLLYTIPTLTGRYNYIPSMKSMNATDINEVIYAIKEGKKIIKVGNKFDEYINSSCQKKLLFDHERYYKICDYFFDSYFKIDKGSFHFKKLQKEIPKNAKIPEKNKTGDYILLNYINFSDKNKIFNVKSRNLPEYIIIGPAERYFSKDITKIDNYKLIFFTDNYKVLKFNG
jgi:hypothetical protein